MFSIYISSHFKSRTSTVLYTMEIGPYECTFALKKKQNGPISIVYNTVLQSFQL